MITWLIRVATVDYKTFDTIISAANLQALSEEITKHGLTMANNLWYPASRIETIEILSEIR